VIRPRDKIAMCLFRLAECILGQPITVKVRVSKGTQIDGLRKHRIDMALHERGLRLATQGFIDRMTYGAEYKGVKDR